MVVLKAPSLAIVVLKVLSLVMVDPKVPSLATVVPRVLSLVMVRPVLKPLSLVTVDPKVPRVLNLATVGLRAPSPATALLVLRVPSLATAPLALNKVPNPVTAHLAPWAVLLARALVLKVLALRWDILDLLLALSLDTAVPRVLKARRQDMVVLRAHRVLSPDTVLLVLKVVLLVLWEAPLAPWAELPVPNQATVLPVPKVVLLVRWAALPAPKATVVLVQAPDPSLVLRDKTHTDLLVSQPNSSSPVAMVLRKVPQCKVHQTLVPCSRLSMPRSLLPRRSKSSQST